jgi:preprotein translocase subunit SecF
VYDLVARRRLYYIFSAIFIVPGLIFILLGGLRPSIDFTGGTEWEARHADRPSAAEMEAALDELGYADAIVSTADDDFLRVRTAPIDLLPPGGPAVTQEPDAAPPVAEGTEFTQLQGELESRFGDAEVRLLRTVGPLISADLIRNSIILIIIGEMLMLVYLWIRFGIRYGTAAVVALLHDVFFVVGIFAILGYFFRVEIDALFVTALLTIIAFSVNDTIVVFDRIRENRVRRAGEPFGAIVNHSLLQTLGRSLLTGLTLLVPVAALVLLGPSTIRGFALTLFLGMGIGVYSSIFNASQLLVTWHEWDASRKARRATIAAR